MSIIASIKNSIEFQRINKSGLKSFSNSLILICKSRPENYLQFKDKIRFGYTVSKSVSKSAVKRNLVKRRIKEASRKLAEIYTKRDFDYIIIARKQIIDADYKEVLNDLKFCLKKIHKNFQ